MDCLRDYIGLTGCGTSSPASGLFINSLPGISLKSVEQLADAEQGTYLGVWNDVQTRALKRFELLLNNELSKEYKLKATKYTIKTKNENYDLSTTILTTRKPSILIESNCYSELNSHFIKSIFFQRTGLSENVTYEIFDYDTNQLLYGQTVVCFNQLSEIVVNKKFYCSKLLIKLQSQSNSYYQNLETTKICDECVDISFGYHDGVKFTNDNFNYGFSLLYTSKCDWNSICCYNKEVFAVPFWYLLGSELMMERMVSDRINKYTVDKKQAEELKAYYDAEFDKAIKQAINGISLESCDCCLECDPLIAIREVMP